MTTTESQTTETTPDFAAMSAPGPEHAVLEVFPGKWNYVCKLWMDPTAEPMESNGTSEYKWILGQRFLVGEYRGGGAFGAPYEGRDLLGYDKNRGEYNACWTDNMATSMMFSKGSYDAGAKTITMQGRHDDCMSGERDKPFKTVTTIISNDEMNYEMFASMGEGGDLVRIMQVHSTRAE